MHNQFLGPRRLVVRDGGRSPVGGQCFQPDRTWFYRFTRRLCSTAQSWHTFGAAGINLDQKWPHRPVISLPRATGEKCYVSSFVDRSKSGTANLYGMDLLPHILRLLWMLPLNSGGRKKMQPRTRLYRPHIWGIVQLADSVCRDVLSSCCFLLQREPKSSNAA